MFILIYIDIHTIDFYCSDPINTIVNFQIGKCSWDFQAGIMAQKVFKFELKKRISAYNFYIQYK